jgi:flagellar motility protein MotE (MotC chaperone)
MSTGPAITLAQMVPRRSSGSFWAGRLPGALAQQAPAPTLEEEIRAFCGNIADAARDQRYLLQKKELEELQAASTSASGLLEERSAKYRDWLKKREDFMQVADTQLVEIYKNMAPDSAASAARNRQAGHCGAIVMKLSPRLASSILNEMDTKKAAALTGPSLPQPQRPTNPRIRHD